MKGDKLKKENIKLENLDPCYLYISISDSVLDNRVENIRNFLNGKINLDTDFKVFNGAEGIEDEEFNNYISNPSLFSMKKIAVIKFIEKVPASLQKRIAELVSANEKQDSGVVFILTSVKRKFNTKLLQKIKKYSAVRQLKIPEGSDIRNWLIKKSRSDGIVFTDGAVSVLLENVNMDLNLLKKEYEKLYDYINSETKKVIDENTVRFLVRRVYSMKVFDLVDCVGKRDKEGSLEALRSLLEENQNMIGLVTLIHRMFKCFLYIKSGDSSSPVTDYIEDKMKIPPYYISKLVSKYIKWSSNYKQAEIVKAFKLLNDYDIKFRSGIGQDDHLIKKLVLEIVDISA